MKLERFKLNENREMYFIGNREPSIEEQKFEIIGKLSQNWSEKLKQEYFVPRSLYKYTLEDLKKIEKHYLNENDSPDIDTKTTIDDPIAEPEKPIIIEDPIEEPENPIDEHKTELEETLKELRSQYLINEAVTDIRIENNNIIFDVLCETQIEGVTEFNGFNIIYNKLCDVKTDNVNNYDVIDDEMIKEQISYWKIK